jgi:hypothetical protein
MLSKEKFIKYLDKICYWSDLQDKLNDLTRECEFLEINVTNQQDLALELLSELMNDNTKDSWILYWFYELDMGRKYKEGCITIDKQNIALETKEDLYDFLASENREID